MVARDGLQGEARIELAQFGDRLFGLFVVASPGVGDSERRERRERFRSFLDVIRQRFFALPD